MHSIGNYCGSDGYGTTLLRLLLVTVNIELCGNSGAGQSFVQSLMLTSSA